jgi:hypothetical protein
MGSGRNPLRSISTLSSFSKGFNRSSRPRGDFMFISQMEAALTQIKVSSERIKDLASLPSLMLFHSHQSRA